MQARDVTVLVEAARGGDLEAFRRLVMRFQDMAYGYAFSLLGDFHRAQDAAQEAFVEAYRDLRDLREAELFSVLFPKLWPSSVPDPDVLPWVLGLEYPRHKTSTRTEEIKTQIDALDFPWLRF